MLPGEFEENFLRLVYRQEEKIPDLPMKSFKFLIEGQSDNVPTAARWFDFSADGDASFKPSE